ncbi:uncharacterized protein FYW61_004834 isoform 2-T2 [Anableps anableps]
MAENCSKSKLKRKKSSVEDLKSEICSRGAPKRSSVALLSRDGVTHTDRSWFPAAAAWWNMLQPPAVESLWAFTLMSALPHLHNQHWDPVPDLPPPPAARPAAPKVEEWWTYDPFSEVPPFPENGPLTLGLPSDPDLPQQNLPVQSRPDWGPSSHSRQSPEQQTEPPRPILSRSQRPAVHRWEKAAPSSAGQPRVRGEQEQGPVSRQLLTRSLKVSNPPVSPGEEEEVQQSVSKHEEGVLQSCPMCLHELPAGIIKNTLQILGPDPTPNHIILA